MKKRDVVAAMGLAAVLVGAASSRSGPVRAPAPPVHASAPGAAGVVHGGPAPAAAQVTALVPKGWVDTALFTLSQQGQSEALLAAQDPNWATSKKSGAMVLLLSRQGGGPWRKVSSVDMPVGTAFVAPREGPRTSAERTYVFESTNGAPDAATDYVVISAGAGGLSVLEKGTTHYLSVTSQGVVDGGLMGAFAAGTWTEKPVALADLVPKGAPSVRYHATGDGHLVGSAASVSLKAGQGLWVVPSDAATQRSFLSGNILIFSDATGGGPVYIDGPDGLDQNAYRIAFKHAGSFQVLVVPASSLSPSEVGGAMPVPPAGGLSVKVEVSP